MKYLGLIFLCVAIASCGGKKDNDKEWDDGKTIDTDSDSGEKEISHEKLDTCQCDLLAFDEAGIAQFKDTTFNGKCHSYNKANGNKYEERLYLQGAIQWIKYYNNFGDLITQYDYENGERKELSTNCDCNKIEYKKVDEKFMAYYDGKLFDGYCRSFYPKGSQIYQEGKFVNGVKEGMHSVYDKSGNILTYEYFENGVLTKSSH